MTPSSLRFGHGFADRDERTASEQEAGLARVVKETSQRVTPKLHFTDEWLRREIARDPDGDDPQAGEPLEGRIRAMSYSFSVNAATKAEAKEKIAKEWKNIVEAQPIHSADRDSAQAFAEASVDNLNDPDATQKISVYASGSVSYRSDNSITAIGGTVNVSLAAKS